MLHRTRRNNGHPLPNALVKRALKGWRRAFRGYTTGTVPIIVQTRTSYDYLRLREAAGSCLAKDLIFCTRSPSKSTVCEELLHAMQLEGGLYNAVVSQYGNLTATLVMEYVAASVLVANEARWAFPPIERKENRYRLRRYSCEIRTILGGMPWHLRSKSLASASFLAYTLECWMGSSLRGR